MATAMTRPATDRPRTTRRIYLPIALACLVIALLGFWPTYFGPLLVGVPHPLAIIHVHAAVFLGWIVLMILQAWFAAHGQIALHMRFGRFGFEWGAFSRWLATYYA